MRPKPGDLTASDFGIDVPTVLGEDRQGDLAHPGVHDADKGLLRAGGRAITAGRPRGRSMLRWRTSYIRANYDTISELCKLNGIPFNATGEKIRG